MREIDKLAFKRQLRAFAGTALALGILIGALWLLHNELRQYHLRDLVQGVAAIPASQVWIAVALTALNYVILGSNWAKRRVCH